MQVAISSAKAAAFHHQVTKDTKVKAKPALKVEEIKAGTRVVITATQEKDKSFKAKTIEVGVAAASAK